MAILARPRDEAALRSAVARAPVVMLTGPRQAGKSTLARRTIRPSPEAFYDLEDHRDLARLAEPTLALADGGETIVIDEAQRVPGLFPTLRVLVDEDRRPGRFVILGSASPDLVGLTSDSLAGRVAFTELGGFRLGDVGPDRLDELWLRGGLPESFLAPTVERSADWRDDYISTFLERDLAGLGFRYPAPTMRRFWMMLAHYHGQRWNATEIARSIGVSASTVARYVDALEGGLVVRQLRPWFVNTAKRQVRAPKVYVRDTGLLHRLLGIDTMLDLLRHPKLGASWEGMIVEQLLASADRAEASYWATHSGAELDLRLETRSRVLGFEIKRTDRPTTTKSMHVALSDLELDHLFVVHAGTHRFRLAERITAVGAAELLTSPDAFDDL